MPAGIDIDRKQRAAALAAVALVQLGLALVLLSGLRLDWRRPADVVERLVEISLPLPPPPPAPPPVPQQHRQAHNKPAAAPKASTPGAGAQPAPVPAAHPYIPAIAGLSPSPPPSGATGTGTGASAGNGGGSGGSGGSGDDGGGTDLEQIAGAITPSDYPRNLSEAGVGGRVGVLFTVGIDGRVSRCTVTRSSGVPQLDQLTCRLIQQRFRYRPSTDASGRAIPDDVEGEHDWIARGG